MEEKRSLASFKGLILLSSAEIELAQGKSRYEYYREYISIHTPWLITTPDFFNDPRLRWDWDFILELPENVINPEEIASLVAS